MSSSLRLTIVVLACIAGLSAAAISSCPSVTAANDLYGAVSSTCSAYATCAAARCTCAGGTAYNATTDACTLTITSNKTCDTATPCQAAFISCMNTAANTVSCLSTLKIAIMSVMSGNSYANSTLLAACKANTCSALNASISGNCSNLDTTYASTCIAPTGTPAPPTPPPVAPGAGYTADMTVGGGFTAIYACCYAAILNATQADLNRFFNNGSNVSYAIVVNSWRNGSAVFSWGANVAANDPVFNQKVTNAVAQGATWLTSLQATYTANGGQGSLTLQGITATNAPATPTPTKGAASVTVAWAFALAAVIAMVIA